MKFMVTWDIHPDKRTDVLAVWCSMTPEQRADAGPAVRLIGRWHNLAEYTGVAIFEADDAAALGVYLGQWNHAMDLDIAPVLDDEETAAAGRQLLEALAAQAPA
jgi:hypothetical protein